MASSTLWRAVWRRYSRSGLAAAGERSSLGLLNPVSCAICSNGLRRTNKEDERRTFSSPALQAFYATVRHDKQSLYLSSLSQFQLQSRRNLETEAAFHPVANETLETIQDSVDGLLDSQTAIDYEVSLAAGVLTIKMFPHGTWVINKQTPNLQLWASLSIVQFCESASMIESCTDLRFAFSPALYSGRVLSRVRSVSNTTMMTNCGFQRRMV